MMVVPEERKSNCSLLDFNFEETGLALNFVEAIAANRPFRNSEEARMAALSLNNIMAFVEYGLSPHEDNPTCEQETIYDGLWELIRACRLVSLRVEQYLDLHEEGKV